MAVLGPLAVKYRKLQPELDNAFRRVTLRFNVSVLPSALVARPGASVDAACHGASVWLALLRDVSMLWQATGGGVLCVRKRSRLFTAATPPWVPYSLLSHPAPARRRRLWQ